MSEQRVIIAGEPVRSIDERTPVQLIDGIYYKRDDLYMPFEDTPMNGGKVRQGYMLLCSAYENGLLDNGIVTQTSVHSTTGTIMAYLCQRALPEPVKCVVCVGGTKPETIDNHHMMRLAKHYGADVRIVCGTGMSGPIMARLNELVQAEGLFRATFSDCIDQNFETDSVSDPILSGQRAEVMNLPDELDNLVVPVGSGIQLTGILQGLELFGKRVKRIIGCHVGPDRRDKMESYNDSFTYGPLPDFELVPLNTAYSKPCVSYMGSSGMAFDPLYEAKAHEWMLGNINTKKEKTAFWVVGRRPTVEEVDLLISP